MAAICLSDPANNPKDTAFWTGMDDSSDNPDAFVPGVTTNGNLRPRPRGRKTPEVKAKVPRKQQMTSQEVIPRKEMLVHELSQSLDESRQKATSRKITLKDLCPADKQRVANLIKELAKVGEEKETAMKQLREEQDRHEKQVLLLVEQQEIILAEREELQGKLFNCLELLTQFQNQVLFQQQQHQLAEQLAEEKMEELKRQATTENSNRNNNGSSRRTESDTKVRGQQRPSQPPRRSGPTDGGEWQETRERGEGQPSHPPPPSKQQNPLVPSQTSYAPPPSQQTNPPAHSQVVFPPPPSKNWQQLSQSYTAQIDEEIAQSRHSKGHDPSSLHPDPSDFGRETGSSHRTSQRPSYPRRVPIPGALRDPIMSSTQKSTEFSSLMSQESAVPGSAEFQPLTPDSSPDSLSSGRNLVRRTPSEGKQGRDVQGNRPPPLNHRKNGADSLDRGSGSENWVSRPYEDEGQRSRRNPGKEGSTRQREEVRGGNQGDRLGNDRHEGSNPRGSVKASTAEGRVGFSDPPDVELTPGRRNSPQTHQSPLLGDRQFMEYYRKLSPSERKQELLRQRSVLLQEQDNLREMLMKQERVLKDKHELIMQYQRTHSQDGTNSHTTSKRSKDQQNHQNRRKGGHGHGKSQAGHSRSPPLLMVAKRLEYSDSETGSIHGRKSPPLLVAARPLPTSPPSLSDSEHSSGMRNRVSAATSPFAHGGAVVTVGTSPPPLPPRTPSPPVVDAGTSVSYHTLRRSPRGEAAGRIGHSPSPQATVASPALRPAHFGASHPPRNKSLSLTEIVQTLDDACDDDLDPDMGFSTPTPSLQCQLTPDLPAGQIMNIYQPGPIRNRPGDFNISLPMESDEDNDDNYGHRREMDAELVAFDEGDDEEEEVVGMMMTPPRQHPSSAVTALGTKGFVPHDDSDVDGGEEFEEEVGEENDSEESKMLEEVFFLK